MIDATPLLAPTHPHPLAHAAAWIAIAAGLGYLVFLVFACYALNKLSAAANTYREDQ